jgi:hypothetical protein
MELILKRGDRPDADVWERAIMHFTNDVYVHTELRFNDGRCFSSQAPDGVRWLPSLDASDPAKWRVIDVSAPLPQGLGLVETSELLEWCESIVGKEYDWVGAVDSGVGVPLENPAAWFCSESSAYGLGLAKRIPQGAITERQQLNIPRMPCPGALYDWVIGLMHGATENTLEARMASRFVKARRNRGRRVTGAQHAC